MSEVLPVLPGNPNALAGFLVGAVAHAGGVSVRVDDRNVGNVDRGLLRHDAAGGGATLVRRDGGVLLDTVHALDEDLAGRRVGRDDLALGALVLARDDEH